MKGLARDDLPVVAEDKIAQFGCGSVSVLACLLACWLACLQTTCNRPCSQPVVVPGCPMLLEVLQKLMQTEERGCHDCSSQSSAYSAALHRA
jgi:hypothetical protein